MSKATPIPDSIEARHGGIDIASCISCGTRITRVLGAELTGGLPWWHVSTGRITCGGRGK
jgi:hypothetical protein